VKQDFIGRTLAQLPDKREDDDVVQVASRLYRVLSFLDRRLADVFGKLGLKHGEVDVLNSLALGGEEPKNPGTVAASLICSSGAMTNRLDRLERAGYIERQHGTADRRSVLLSITPEGRRAVQRANAARDAVADQIVPGLTAAERKQLTGLLRKMLIAFENDES